MAAFAALALLAICAETVATPMNTMPTAQVAAQYAKVPLSASPNASMLAARPIVTTVLTIATHTTAAASVAWRPTTAARTSSARSVSSSARVWRVTRNMHIRATTMNV